MSTLPDTDLSADLTTDSGDQPSTSTRFEDTIFAPLHRLRPLVRQAGLLLTFGFPEDTADGDRLPVDDAGEAAVRELAAILAAASTTPQPVPETPGITGAALWLRTAAQAAHIDLHLGTPRSGPDGQDRLPLGTIDHGTATRLADLIEQHLADLYHVEDALRAALDRISVTPEEVSVDGGAIALGEITVPEGRVLLRHLVPGVSVRDADPDDQCAGEALATHLTDAIKNVTGGGFIDAAYTPYCRRCRGDVAIILGKLAPPYAQALTAHLTQAAA